MANELTVESIRKFRAKVVKYNNKFKFVDYSHNPESLPDKSDNKFIKGLTAEKMICQLLALEAAFKLPSA